MKKPMKALLFCGMLGCLCYGGGDWLMPVSAFRLGFTNGLMSESMIIWFGIMLIREIMEKNKEDS